MLGSDWHKRGRKFVVVLTGAVVVSVTGCQRGGDVGGEAGGRPVVATRDAEHGGPPPQTQVATHPGTQATTKASGYTTRFSHDENPISEAAKWINGKKEGRDWADVCTAGGLAHGTESGHSGYDDSVGLLAGPWAADQTVQATVHTVNQKGGNIYEEVELRLRSAIAPGRCTGYEINFRCSGHGSGYNEIVRWDGPLGKFTYLSQKSGGVADGDVIKATMVGNVITVYRNGVQVNQAKDSTFTSGQPGIGFYLQGGPASLNGDYGFTAFSAE